MSSASAAAHPVWHATPPAAVLTALEVGPNEGLSSSEAGARAGRFGANRLAEAARESRWHALLRQFQDWMILVLLVAAGVSFAVTGDLETPIAIVVVVILNASIGFVQESRAEASLEALRKMSVATATVRRDGRLVRLDAAELVPGDIVVVEAGDHVPADARLLTAASLEVQESALTGEAHAVAKSVTSDVATDAALGDRTSMLFMNTAVTRGRAEAVVTATGMNTEVGHIAGMLSQTKPAPTPLQRQISVLGKTLAGIAGLVVAAVLALGLSGGRSFGELFVSAVVLAVAAIPEGLPAVVAFTLAMGTGRLARRGAIVKRLGSVETLGSTSQICTDKTGTLTMNQMTARVVILAGRRFTVSGEGYSTEGRIRTTDGAPFPKKLQDALTGMALCTDAVVQGQEVVGDPTEAALVVLAEKGGVDVVALREERGRMLEIPFDSDYKFMATFHRWTNDAGEQIVRCFVKGAPDVLAARADRYLGESSVVPFDAEARARHERANAELAAQGLRVLAIGAEDFPLDGFTGGKDPKQLLDKLVLLALVGIIDPPRPEARQAISECRRAGIRVRMITGDHAVTAGAIARDLGIVGRAVTGAELETIPDDGALGRALDEIGVIARVSPAHKLRIVRALQARGDVVAMTGDGVNDAPALRQADIGVAMGVAGTAVTREAATLVLTDDNFATIVSAVREGRGIYDNIVKFTQFQVSTALGFVLSFLIASLTGVADGVPFTALQVLFVNLIMDGPPAMSLGVDRVANDAMDRPPRGPSERILTPLRLARIAATAAVMTAGTLAVLVNAPGPTPTAGAATPAGTMAFVTFVFFQIFNLLCVRHDTHSFFGRETFENSSALLATTAVVVLLAFIVEMDVLHGVFTTTNLSSKQWLICVAVASSVLWVSELSKLALRVAASRRTVAAI